MKICHSYKFDSSHKNIKVAYKSPIQYLAVSMPTLRLFAVSEFFCGRRKKVQTI
jgi:hypothetical protein